MPPGTGQAAGVCRGQPGDTGASDAVRPRRACRPGVPAGGVPCRARPARIRAAAAQPGHLPRQRNRHRRLQHGLPQTGDWRPLTATVLGACLSCPFEEVMH